MELADYLRALRARWIAVAATVGVCAVAGFIYSNLQPEVYATSSSGFVTYGSAGDISSDNANDVLSKSRAASYVALAKDRETASIVIDDLGIDTTPEALVGDIEASQTPGTVIVTINARAETPDEARLLADAWIAALAERVADLEAVDAEQGLRIEVAESALLPTTPVSPRVERNVLLSAVLGALLGCAYAFLRAILDRRLRSREEIETTSGVSVIGSIPEFAGASGLLVTEARQEVTRQAAEEVRRLRTNLSYLDAEGTPRSVVVTSPNSGDGKTTIAVNLAAAIALTGQRVTLVDANLRNSDLAHVRGLESRMGLTDVLRGDAELDEALQPDPEVDGLFVLTAGTPVSNPSEVLTSQTMRSLMAALTGSGVVIVDAPPLMAVTDAAIVARLVDGALIVVNAGATHDTDLAATIDYLRAVHARPLGVVLNRTHASSRRGRGPLRTLERYNDSTEADGERTRILQV